MEGQEYLNQISATNRPAAKSGFGRTIPVKYLWIGLAIAAVIVFFVVIGTALSNSKSSEKELGFALQMHIDSTQSIINEYQRNVKSSILRSSSSSLSGVLANTNSGLSAYLNEKYKALDKNAAAKLQTEIDTTRDGILNDLFAAKINGNLDRIYAHKMAYEVSMIMSEESKIFESTKDDVLKEILETSYNSLGNLYDQFNDFSETK